MMTDSLTSDAVCVERPHSAEAVRELIATAAASQSPVEILGAGTKRGIGGTVRATKVIELTLLSGILEYEPAELVMTVRAGTKVADIEAALAQNRQMLAFEPIDHGPLLGCASGAATIGGVLAGNISGPRRLKDGAARDHFLGFEAISGRGEQFKAGGKVVKNVTGYDLPKLLAGSWGTLAVLTEVTVKVLPQPPVSATLRVAGLSANDAVRVMSIATGSPVEVSGAAYLPQWAAARCPVPEIASADSGMALLRLEGFGPSVTARCDYLRERLGSFGPLAVLGSEESLALWRFIRDVGPFHMSGHLSSQKNAFGNDSASSAHELWPLWRINVPPMNGAAVESAIAARAQVRSFHDWAGGLVWLAVAPDASTQSDAGASFIQEAARNAGGHATLIRASDTMRAGARRFSALSSAVLDLARRVKAGFDPANILNPARLPGTGQL